MGNIANYTKESNKVKLTFLENTSISDRSQTIYINSDNNLAIIELVLKGINTLSPFTYTDSLGNAVAIPFIEESTNVYSNIDHPVPLYSLWTALDTNPETTSTELWWSIRQTLGGNIANKPLPLTYFLDEYEECHVPTYADGEWVDPSVAKLGAGMRIWCTPGDDIDPAMTTCSFAELFRNEILSLDERGYWPGNENTYFEANGTDEAYTVIKRYTFTGDLLEWAKAETIPQLWSIKLDFNNEDESVSNFVRSIKKIGGFNPTSGYYVWPDSYDMILTYNRLGLSLAAGGNGQYWPRTVGNVSYWDLGENNENYLPSNFPLLYVGTDTAYTNCPYLTIVLTDEDDINYTFHIYFGDTPATKMSSFKIDYNVIRDILEYEDAAGHAIDLTYKTGVDTYPFIIRYGGEDEHGKYVNVTSFNSSTSTIYGLDLIDEGYIEYTINGVNNLPDEVFLSLTYTEDLGIGISKFIDSDSLEVYETPITSLKSSSVILTTKS